MVNSAKEEWVLVINPKSGKEQEICNSLALIARKYCCSFAYISDMPENQIKMKHEKSIRLEKSFER